MALILIVEDEMPINVLINRNLKLVGHECISVYDGEAALEMIQKHTFDLILLDIMLPKMNGYEVLEAVKKIEYTSYISYIKVPFQIELRD